MDRIGTRPFARQCNAILALLLAVTAAAWLYLAWRASGMAMPAGSPAMGLRVPLFLLVWIVMMTGLMFPAAAPMVLTFHRVQLSKRARGNPFVATWVFVAGYLLVWTLAGAVAYAGAAGAELLAASARLSVPTIGRIGGGILFIAGIYQFSPLKAHSSPYFPWDTKESGDHRGDSGKNCTTATGGISLRIRQADFQ
ncbi:MAG: DUF2182 domain-containing protein, partial [Rhodospirillales bacterium]|nr:DUF2182 domain-containing protein [Rhodospirillales bacterium]